MKGYTVEEAAVLLKQPTDYLFKKILFSDKSDPILKPCAFFHHPRSFRVINVGEQSSATSIECLPKQVAFDVGNGRRRNYSYSSVNIQGLFELTFFPDNFDMTETKESGFIQLYKEKAVFADHLAEFSINMAVGWIMSGWKDFDDIRNQWYAMTTSEASSTKSRIMSRIGQFIILSQNGFHYLVDTPASISLSDICITDKMLTEYAASVGIDLNAQDNKKAPDPMSVPAKLPEPLYITASDAAGVLGVHVERIKFFILEHYLTAYISGREAEPFGEMTENLAESGEVFFHLKQPIKWCTGEGIKPQESCTLHYKKVLFKQSQVLELKQCGTTTAFESYSKPTLDLDNLLPAQNLQTERAKQSDTDETIKTVEELIEYYRGNEEPAAVIAFYIKKVFPKESLYDLMKKLDPKRVIDWENSSAKQGRPKQWFYDLCIKGEKILAAREKMTSSETKKLPVRDVNQQ